MASVRSPVLGSPRGRRGESVTPRENRRPRHPQERRSALALEVSNADPTGQISVEIEVAGAGEACFETKAPLGLGTVVAATLTPEFVAIDPTAVTISVGAGRGFHEQIDFSILLAILGSGGAAAVKLALDAAPGTSVRAVLGVGSVWSLDSGTAILPLPAS